MADEKRGEVDELASQVAKQLATRSQRAVMVWVLGAILAGGGLISTGALESVARPNPFTSVDGERLEADIAEVDVRLRLLEAEITVEQAECQVWRDNLQSRIDAERKAMEWEIRKDMPPAATKARIRACERWIEKQDMTWQPPTLEWQ